MILSLAVADSARSKCDISFHSSSGRAGMNEQSGPTSFTLSKDNPGYYASLHHFLTVSSVEDFVSGRSRLGCYQTRDKEVCIRGPVQGG